MWYLYFVYNFILLFDVFYNVGEDWSCDYKVWLKGSELNEKLGWLYYELI